MKRKLCKISGILIAAMLLLSMTAFPSMAGVPDYPHAGNAMWIEPLSIDLNTADHDVGYRFNITVWVNITVPSYSWQVTLYFCSECLNATGCVYSEGAFSQFFAGHATIPVVPIIDNVNDYVLHGESLVGEDQRAPGFGSLCIIEFEVIKVPEKGADLNCEFDISNPYENYLEDPVGELIPLTLYNAPYNFVWVPPGPATLRVHNPGPLGVDPLDPDYPDPHSFFFNRSQIWNCTWFPVDIYLDISTAWFITTLVFYLSYDTSILYTDPTGANITTYAFPISTPTVIDGTIEFIFENPCGNVTIGGNVLIATIYFHIHDQPIFPTVVTSPLDLIIEVMLDHFYSIPYEEEDGLVTVEGYMLMAPPWLEVSPPVVTMGPEPSICKTFEVDVTINELDVRWELVAVQFRLTYCPDLIDFVECDEGPFMQDPEWNLYGTFPLCWPEENTMYGPHVLAGDLLLPDENGTWAKFPHGSGVLFTITFHVAYQSYPHNFSCPLDFIEILLVNKNSEPIPVDMPKVVNGTYNIVTNLPGRMIDLYTQYPAPYGGQGPNNPSDMFWPQRIVYLYTKVTYNYYPVNNKDVGFEVEGPFDQETGEPLPRYQIWLKTSARTNKDGIAWIKFQLPWPCEDPEGLFGKWKVTATVDICEVVVIDTLTFDYQYLVTWVDVTVDREPLKEYKHCEWVEITVTFKSKAQQPRWVLITAVLEDNLQTPVGIAMAWILVQGAQPCHWVEYEVTLSIHVPQHAFAGPAWIHVNAFTDDPTVGGVPWCPEYEPAPEIYIQPF